MLLGRSPHRSLIIVRLRLGPLFLVFILPFCPPFYTQDKDR
jgi:hypothetical protein